MELFKKSRMNAGRTKAIADVKIWGLSDTADTAANTGKLKNLVTQPSIHQMQTNE